MRKAILVVALIGASFAGGAVVNGPCLGWAQSYLTHQLGGDAPAPVDDDLAAPSIDEIPLTDESDPGGALPAAPLPPLTATPVDAPVPTLTRTPTPTPISAPAAAPKPSPAPASVPTPEEPAPLDLDRADPPLSGPSAEEETTAATEDVPAPPAPAPVADNALGGEDEPESAAWKDAPDSLAPARPILPTSPNAPTTPNAADPAVATAGLAAQAGDSSSWSAMRKKLREAGVARYWIEGEPGGDVRLRCLIPLAGQRAVGQQFEADGPSEAQAAASVLRRIALWKATETP